MRIFIDVGAHYGETLHVTLDPRWDIDRLFVLEPASSCVALLRKFKDPRLTVVPAGLSNRSAEATLYGAGLLGGSVYQDKKQLAPEQVRSEAIALLRASDWVATELPRGAEVLMKLNCEGSECDVLLDLMESGMIHRIRSLYIDFDVRKVASQQHKQVVTEKMLQERRVSYSTPDSLGCKGNTAVRKWLAAVCPVRARRPAASVSYGLKMYAPRYIQATLLARALLPKKVFWWLGQRFGRLSKSP
jgi:FkbM family methyltransferase